MPIHEPTRIAFTQPNGDNAVYSAKRVELGAQAAKNSESVVFVKIKAFPKCENSGAAEKQAL